MHKKRGDGMGPRDDGKIRVLVVDDSAAMRSLLFNAIESDARLKVVGDASSVEEAEAMLKSADPDVMTLDIEMPGCDGVTFLKRLMRSRPMPIVMCSSFSQYGSVDKKRALAAGAAACIVKPRSLGRLNWREVCDAIHKAAHMPLPKSAMAESDDGQLFLIGASTGGVQALEILLSKLPPLAPPMVIAQHMPQDFLEKFARRLDGSLTFDVAIAQDQEMLEAGCVRFAPAEGVATYVRWCGHAWTTYMQSKSQHFTYRPSVDALFLSAATHGENVVAAILSGLGDDGAQGMAALRNAGARTFGQSQDSCAVYSMPAAAKLAGGVDREIHVSQLSDAMMHCKRTMQ